MSLPRHAVLIDFGSTFTKLVVAETGSGRLLLSTRVASTVKSDATIGLEQCFAAARELLGESAFADAAKLASSSAAGGLRMAVVGLSQTLSAKAGRQAACGAGAKILRTCAGALTAEEVAALSALPLELLLFTGGYEGGGTATLLHNARLLAASELRCPLIYAGNSAAAAEVRAILTLGGKECFLAENIIPRVGALAAESAEAIIRAIFMERIVAMKGLSAVLPRFDQPLLPTPAVVLAAGELLACGCDGAEGVGSALLFDVGGATTDVYSFCDPATHGGAKQIGAADAFAKRTVEGDLGLRESSNSLLCEAGVDWLVKQSGLSAQIIEAGVASRVANNHCIATDESARALDTALTAAAVRLAARRHCGRLEPVLAAGVRTVQLGKDLSAVPTVIGTGGPLALNDDPRRLLSFALRDSAAEEGVLLPARARFLLDREYVFFAAGLLRACDPAGALRLMRHSLVKLE